MCAKSPSRPARADTPPSIGSGVILSADGIVLTNAHVVSPRAVELNITLSNLERVSAKLVGWDHWTDLAVLRIDMAEVKRRGFKLAHAQFGDSTKLYPGQEVYAVGTPHGLTRTVTRGIVSNKNRYFEDNRGVDGYETGTFNTWLQTDAAINPGNSGGPLVTGGRQGDWHLFARLHGREQSRVSRFPLPRAKTSWSDSVRDGAVSRSYVGIVPARCRISKISMRWRLNTGLLINSVDPGFAGGEGGTARRRHRAGDRTAQRSTDVSRNSCRRFRI